ncbi:MAG: hypothetical protein HY716_17565 [Planctomycetes bacterium]|nr:hypothetical protein [Planctomycetota bacterium]
MKTLGSFVAILFLFQEAPCRHPTRGATKAVDLDAVERAHVEVAKAFHVRLERAEARSRTRAFDVGLPACRARRTRRTAVDRLPEGMPSLYFAKEGSRTPPEAVWIATSGRLAGPAGAAAHPKLLRRFDIRCVPTLVKPISIAEVELVEGE